MSNNTDQQIETVKGEIIDALSNNQIPPYPPLIEACWDRILSGITDSPRQGLEEAFQTLIALYLRFFPRTRRGLTATDSVRNMLKDSIDPKSSSSGTQPSKKSESKATGAISSYQYDCCLPCSDLSLEGDRAIKMLDGTSTEKIKNILYADAFWNWFIERTDIDKISGGILSDQEFGGKFPILYDDWAGGISQIMINEVNKGVSSRRRQRTAVSLKMLGMRIDGSYSGLKLSDMQISPGMSIALQLVAKIENFYNYRRVVQTIEAIANKKESQQTLASIRTSIELLRRSSERFRSGTNAHNTVSSTVWKLAGFWLVLLTSKETGVSQQTRFEDIVDSARNTILFNKIGAPSEISKTKIYIDCANDLTDFILCILSKDETYWNTQSPIDNLKIFLDIVEPLVEHFIASFKEATGIDLTDKNWISVDPVVSHDLPNRL